MRGTFEKVPLKLPSKLFGGEKLLWGCCTYT